MRTWTRIALLVHFVLSFWCSMGHWCMCGHLAHRNESEITLALSLDFTYVGLLILCDIVLYRREGHAAARRIALYISIPTLPVLPVINLAFIIWYTIQTMLLLDATQPQLDPAPQPDS